MRVKGKRNYDRLYNVTQGLTRSGMQQILQEKAISNAALQHMIKKQIALLKIRNKIINRRNNLQAERVPNPIPKHIQEDKKRSFFKLKPQYNSIIPCTIYQTWITKDLPDDIKENIQHNKECNPKFEFLLYDDDDCRVFMEDNFVDYILEAYDKLGSYESKSEFWSYCILYINGGIYADLKFKCSNGFKFIALIEEEQFPVDPELKEYFNEESRNIDNALIAVKPRNKQIFEALMNIVEMVNN
jgi:mannosyltransferase OCH1-like enzyme